ncbi:hypothetical protein AHAS_Ahas09G0092100 [Arachis hypogaea]
MVVVMMLVLEQQHYREGHGCYEQGKELVVELEYDKAVFLSVLVGSKVAYSAAQATVATLSEAYKTTKNHRSFPRNTSLQGFHFFRENNYGIQFVFYFIYVNLQIAFAFLVAALFLNVKTATVTAYIVVFGTGLVAAFLFPDLIKNDLFSMAKSQALLPQSLFGFLPKAVPFPPSGPSRNHNGIELHSSLLGKGKP